MGKVTLTCAVGNVESWNFTANSGFSGIVADVYILYLDTTYFANKDNHFSLNANVRDPDKSKATNAMDTTLTSPEKNRFWAYNGGLIVVAKEAKTIGKKTLELNLPKDYGLLNGGHTQMALEKAAKNGLGSEPPVVRVEVIVGDFSNDHIAEIARARNTVTNVAAFSVLNKSGALKPLRKEFDPDYVNKFKWKQNDKDAVEGAEKIDNVTHRLKMLDDSRKIGKNSGEVKSIHAGTAAIIEDMAEGFAEGLGDGTMFHLTKIVNDSIELWDAIKYEFCINPDTGNAWLGAGNSLQYDSKILFPHTTKKNKTSLITGDTHEFICKEQVVYPVFAAFGVLLDMKPKNKTIRWRKDPMELWKNKELREKLYKRFRLHVKNNSSSLNNLKKNPTLIQPLKAEINSYAANKSSGISEKKYSW